MVQHPWLDNLNMDNYRILIVSNPQDMKLADNKSYFDQKSDKTITSDLDMRNHKIKDLGTPLSGENDAAVNVQFFNRELS